MLNENPDLKEAGVEIGSIGVSATEEDMVKVNEHIGGAEETIPTAPETAVEPEVEPQKRYRGKVILEESDRVVGEQTFKHISLEDGTQYDLTDMEYKGEVYPSQA